MASSNVKETITTHLKDYHALAKELIQSFLNTGENPQEIMKRLIAKDTELFQAVKQLEEHQRYQQKLAEIQKEIEEKDKVVLDLVIQLRKLEEMLQEIVDAGKAKIAIMDQVEQGAIDPETLVAYAHKISSTTTGPPSGIVGQEAVYHPPAPQEAEMRSGHLYTKVEKVSNTLSNKM